MSDCEHRRIATLVYAEGEATGQVAAWMCAGCRRKFSPLDTAIDEAMRLALRDADAVVERLRALHRTTMGYEDACVLRGAEMVADALRAALGEER
jgi:hypothetical protein